MSSVSMLEESSSLPLNLDLNEASLHTDSQAEIGELTWSCFDLNHVVDLSAGVCFILFFV